MSISDPQGRRKIDRLLLALLLPGLLSALWLAAGRYRLESGNKSVELTLDYSELQNLSMASGVQMPEILARFKNAGVTGVAVTEDLLGDLVETGQVSYTQRASDTGPLTVIYVPDRQMATRVLQSLSARLRPDMISARVGPEAASAGTPNTFVVRAAPSALNTMGIGLSPDAVRIVKRAGLDVVARLQNHPALTKEAVDAAVSDMEQEGIERLICAGDETFGFRGLTSYAARKFKSAGLIYGSIEFGKQKGDAGMSEELDSHLIRVHSVSSAEMAGLAPSDAVERFARAVKERNIRLCYVRLPATSGESPIEDSIEFVSAIGQEIRQSGYRPGIARPFGAMARHACPLALMGLSIAAGGVLLLGVVISLSTIARYGLLIVGLIGLAGLTQTGEMGRQLAALAAALVFPTLGVAALVAPSFNRDVGAKSPVRKATVLFIGASAFSLLGALMVVGLLADRSYMVKVSQFVGVKVAHLFPILAVAFIMAAGLPILSKPFSEMRREVAANLRRLVSHPLFMWHALAVGLALGIIGFALLRTGNDPGVGVSGMELKFRAILDRIMVVRPRTKEFLIAHPALLIGIALLLTRRRSWGLPLVALGMLGQASLLNTFCHIHTPLSVSVLRAGNGLILGLILGLAVWYLLANRGDG